MIPYISLPNWQIGFLVIFTFGMFVSLGFIAGLTVAYFRAKGQRLRASIVFDLVFFIILGAIVGGRIFHVLFYEPTYYFVNPVEILKIWQGGFSSFGGLFGAFLAVWFYLKKHHLNFWSWFDTLAFALPLGWAIGRLGCFLTHHHFGIKSNVFLAMRTVDGSRLEMALIEAILVLLLFIYFLSVRRHDHFHGFYFINFMLIYGLIRFVLDFFRAYDLVGADVRYYGLTPAQYGSVLMMVVGVYLLSHEQKEAIL